MLKKITKIKSLIYRSIREWALVLLFTIALFIQIVMFERKNDKGEQVE